MRDFHELGLDPGVDVQMSHIHDFKKIKNTFPGELVDVKLHAGPMRTLPVLLAIADRSRHLPGPSLIIATPSECKTWYDAVDEFLGQASVPSSRSEPTEKESN